MMRPPKNTEAQMYKSITAVVFALLFCCTWAGAQQNGDSLFTAAARDGYVVQWLLPDRSVSLTRPGMAIIVRPGEVMYSVNNHVEFTDIPPRYVNGDLLVSSTLVARLARLARFAAAAQPRPRMETAPGMAVSTETPASGPITIDVRPQTGSEAIAVSGHAPSNAPVTITLLATFSTDVPTVVVSRHDVQPDVSGNFAASIPIAAAFARGTLLRIVAASVAGTTPASAQLVVGVPNAGVIVPLEQQPDNGP
jgi:hypothetical protein